MPHASFSAFCPGARHRCCRLYPEFCCWLATPAGSPLLPAARCVAAAALICLAGGQPHRPIVLKASGTSAASRRCALLSSVPPSVPPSVPHAPCLFLSLPLQRPVPPSVSLCPSGQPGILPHATYPFEAAKPTLICTVSPCLLHVHCPCPSVPRHHSRHACFLRPIPFSRKKERR